jgi:DNA-directed RNA polymerase subunit RPC12/RpoP
MTKTFNCSSCSAPLEFEGTPTQKCRYCHSTVIAPAESRRATDDELEKVKKIGYTIGGSILTTIVVSLLIIGGVTISIIYFSWTAVDKMAADKAPKLANTTTPTSSPNLKATPTPEMTEIMRIGGEGTGAGLFDDNRHVAVDGQGRIYSSNYSPHRIQVFDAGGKFLNQWGPESGSNLYDLVADRDGNVYVANDKGVFKHEGGSGTLLAKSSAIYPRGLALTWDGKLVVTTRRSLVVLDSSLKILREFKDAAESANSTSGFEKIATDGTGAIYGLEWPSGDVCKFSADGKFLNRFSTKANSAHALAVDPKGRLFISDTSTIYAMDTNGHELKSLKAFQAFGITFDQAGDLFIAARPYVLKQKLAF